MRYKFRAWDNVANQMLYAGEDMDVIFVLGSAGIECTDVRNGAPSGDGIDSMDHLIYMQFTRLKDASDNEMYEGDVVWCDSSNEIGYEYRVICYDIFQAKYKTVPIPAYHLNSGRGGWTGYELRYHNRVIGNIYENPELLEATV